jgi:hypothetical protein
MVVATSVIPAESVVETFSTDGGLGIPAGIVVSSFHKKTALSGGSLRYNLVTTLILQLQKQKIKRF